MDGGAELAIGAHPFLWVILVAPGGRGASTPTGYSPRQMQHAYGIDQIVGTGQGQTVASVDACGSPTIRADLATATEPARRSGRASARSGFDLVRGLGAPPWRR